MLDIIKSIVQLIVQFINSIYNIEIDFDANTTVKLGTLFIAFISFLLILKIIFEALGLKKGDDENA